MVLLLKNLIFTALVPGTVAIAVPLWIASDRSEGSAVLDALAVVAFAVGASIYAWCVWDFATFGRGTPAPIDAPKKLVVRGLYRATRNPMYLGVLTVILGWALWFQAVSIAIYAAAICAMFSLFVILYEEPHLRSEFGDEYEAYRARVGRWLPRLRLPRASGPGGRKEEVSTMAATHSGGCLCGAVRYELSEEPLTFYACHCTDCQRQTGSAFGLSMIVPRSGVRLVTGEPREFAITMPDGRVKRGRFCDRCATRLWGEPVKLPSVLVLRPGTLDDPEAFRPVGNIWTGSARSWLPIFPDGANFPAQPEDPAALVKAWSARSGK